MSTSLRKLVPRYRQAVKSIPPPIFLASFRVRREGSSGKGDDSLVASSGTDMLGVKIERGTLVMDWSDNEPEAESDVESV